MCDLSEGVKREGKIEGIQEERLASAIKHVSALMFKKNMSADEAMELLEIAADIRPAVTEHLKK